MKYSNTTVLAIGVFILGTSGHAQTYPSVYPPVPNINLPGNNQPVLATDVIFGARVQNLGTPSNPFYAISDYGGVPINQFAFAADVQKTNQQVAAVQQFAYDARREARQGIAASMAMTTASMPSAPGRTSWTLNASQFQNYTGFSGSLAHRFDLRVPLAITGGFAVSGSGGTGGRVGLAGEF
jgi:hypothetical protein